MSQCGCRPPGLGILIAVLLFMSILSARFKLMTYEHRSVDYPDDLSFISGLYCGSLLSAQLPFVPIGSHLKDGRDDLGCGQESQFSQVR